MRTCTFSGIFISSFAFEQKFRGQPLRAARSRFQTATRPRADSPSPLTDEGTSVGRRTGPTTGEYISRRVTPSPKTVQRGMPGYQAILSKRFTIATQAVVTLDLTCVSPTRKARHEQVTSRREAPPIEKAEPLPHRPPGSSIAK